MYKEFRKALSNPALGSAGVTTLLTICYHKQALTHNDVQFWAGLIAGSVALGLGIGLVFYVLWTPGLSAQVAVVESLLGVILNAISVLFFRQMEKTNERADRLYDRLVAAQREIQAMEVADSIRNPTVQGDTKAKIALGLAARKTEID